MPHSEDIPVESSLPQTEETAPSEPAPDDTPTEAEPDTPLQLKSPRSKPSASESAATGTNKFQEVSAELASEPLEEPLSARAEDVTQTPPAAQAPQPTDSNTTGQAIGRGLWLSLAIGVVGLLVTLLLPWVSVFYLNPLQPLHFADSGAIQFTRDEVVHISLRGFSLLTLNLWPLLALFSLAALLFGAVIYWRQTHFAQRRLTWAILGLGLLVGIGFPVTLWVFTLSTQQVDWSKSHATIEANQTVHTYASNGGLYLCTPTDRSDHHCDSDYSNGIILSAGIDWTEVSGTTGASLIRGHADSVRDSATSPNVTTSGYAVGPFEFMNPSFGYWGAWLFSLWVLLSALLLLRRLVRARR